MGQKTPKHFNIESFLRNLQTGTKVVEYKKKTNIFVQGLKLTVISEQGKRGRR
jgi:hypothetical protein